MVMAGHTISAHAKENNDENSQSPDYKLSTKDRTDPMAQHHQSEKQAVNQQLPSKDQRMTLKVEMSPTPYGSAKYHQIIKH